MKTIEQIHRPPTQSSSSTGASMPAANWRGLMLVVFFIGLAWINLSRLPVDAAMADQSIEAAKVGFLAPDFTLPNTDGDDIALSELRGRPVVLNFWATWCPPCRAEMPALEQTWQRYGKEGVLILGINQGESQAVVERFARGTVDTTFPLLLDRRTEVGRTYAVRALPTTVFVDAEGRIQDIKVGGPLNLATILDGLRQAKFE